MTRTTPSASHTCALALTLVAACTVDGVVDGTGPALEPSGSPTSFPYTDGDTPTSGPASSGDTGFGTDTSTGGASDPSTSGADGETGSPAACGDGQLAPGEGCDDGAANGPYAACTDECQVNVCGDGKVLAGAEQCDEGPANIDTGYCRGDCTLNVCGDGHLFAGVEQCDDGADNGEVYGGCDPACTINRCGDGEHDEGHEECDDGDDNGGGGEVDKVGCDPSCGLAGRRLFLSSRLFTGDMDQHTGADQACREMAAAAGYLHAASFLAVLGSSAGSPNSNLAGDASDLPFIDPFGAILAKDYAALLAQGPGVGLFATETGESLSDELVWTNVDEFGDAYSLDPAHTCNSWTSADFNHTARVGRNGVGPVDFPQWQAGHQWIDYDDRACNNKFRIYCVQGE
jgi:hypothetical protein